jgi:glucan-binding YG repeat protein
MGSFEDGRRNGVIFPAASPSQSPAQSAARGTNVTSTAKEQMVNVTSRAHEKVDHTKATATAVLSKIAHPLSSQTRQDADAKAAETKAQASAKQASIRTTVQQQQQQQTETTTPRTSIPSERDPTPAAAGGIPKPLGGTQDSAYTDISRGQDSPPASTLPHADVRTTSSGRLQTHHY